MGPDDRDLDEEIRSHLALSAKERIERGENPEAARLAALREFGYVPAIRESMRRVWYSRWIDAVAGSVDRAFNDLRFALRQLIKSPGFTVLAIVTLGLGIGANTSMFSVLNEILLRPLPYADSAQLDSVSRATPQNARGGISPADFLDLRRETDGYGAIAAYTPADASLSEPGRPAEVIAGLRVTSNFFATLGAPPYLGRDFRSAEELAGNDRVVIISHRCWRNRFGGSADIIGRTIRVDGEPHEIVGVLAPTFNDWRHLGWVDVFRPLALDRDTAADRRATTIRLIGRRSTTISRSEAERFVANFGARLAASFPEVHAGSSWRSVPLNREIVTDGPIALSMLIGLSGFVLLIACSNLANLLLARTMARAREFAVRGALGASRIQLLRPLIAESLALAAAGGVCAVIVATWVADWLAVRSTGDNGEQVILALDWHVLGWALGASLATCVAFGLAPALFAMRLDPNETLKSGGRGATGGRGHRRFRHVLIVGQFALAMVLLAGAGLFVRGLHDLNQRRSGWASEHLITGTVLLPEGAYHDAEAMTAFHGLTVERLESLPGVASASVSSFTPFFNWPDARKYLVQGGELPAPGREPAALVNSVSPHYFDTVGTRLLSGRTFTAHDTLASPKVFIVNEAMARALFGNASPIGRRVAQAGVDPPHFGEIVGVVTDIQPVVADPVPVTSQLYQPMAQEPRARSQIAVRTAGVAPATVVAGIRAAMTTLNPDLPVRRLQPADATIFRANYQLAVLRDMLTSFAILGLGLAALGIYGVIARTMAQRTGEFAIRLALGATVRHITRMVLGSGVKLAVTGAALGLLGAAAVSRLLGSAFPGMQFDGAPVVAGATVFLIAVALLACYLPARTASRISPVEALRLE